MTFKDFISLNNKDSNYYVVIPFEFHTPKKCLNNILTEPDLVLFGKVYSNKGNFDVTQCLSSKTKFTEYKELDDRYVLYYNEGDMFCSDNMIASGSNEEVIFNLFMQGQILEDIEYKNIYTALRNVIEYNVDLDVPLFYYEYTVAAMLRDTKDKSKMVRLTNPNGSFKSLSVKEINSRADSFVSVTTNDPETMLISALNERPDAPTTPIKKTFFM